MTLETRIDLRVQENEIDELGHVNNARFLEYFERGRMDWYNRCDPALNNPDGRHLGTVVVNIDVNYRRECFSGEKLSLVTRAHKRGRTSYVLHQEIFASDGQCVCDAKVTSVIMDMGTRKVASLPDTLARQFAREQNRETS
jgi:YbgC/YbaW family acyl-CoA thioester hydrolase